MEDRPRETSNRIDGDVGTALQIGTVNGRVYVNAVPPEPEPEADPPRGWDDLPQLPPEVRALLDAQIRTAADLPYRLPGARRPSLAAVYVRQDISSETDSGRSEPVRPRPKLDGRGQWIEPPARPVHRLVVRPPSRTVRAALDDDDHLLVTGGPGQGKSTLSLRLAADVATHWNGQEGDAPLAEPVVPVRLPARELATRLAMPFFQALAESIQAEYGALLDFSIEAGTLAGRVVGCRWLLLVDGLDEVADPVQRDRLIKVLVTRASQEASAHYRLVLTTRPIAGAALAPFHGAGAARYELLPFDEEALHRFAANWFTEDDTAGRFVRQVHDANLDELVRVPLLATIAAIMFEQDGDRRLPDNRYELYEAYLAYLQTARPSAPSPWGEHHERLVEHLACARLEKDTSLLAAACAWATAHVPQACGPTHWRDELTTYLTSVGLFVSRGGDVAFLHHSFAEHLAATAHARDLPARFDPDDGRFVRLVHTARPGERGRHARLVLLHYTRLRQSEADRLLEYLHEGNADKQVLAARLLAWHAPAGAEVTNAFLNTARAWAMTTQHPAQAILAQVSRAAHHPGLVGWLQDLMRDEEAPWESRIEAGRALATRLYGPGRLDAVAMLRSVVHDETIPVEVRFDSARALAECGPGERATAVTGLLSVLVDTTATALHCRNAAIVLAGLGSGPRTQAIEALAGLLDDPEAPEEDLVQAAMGLLEIGAGYEDRCAEVFRTVLVKGEGVTLNLRNAALGLASLGPDQLAEAVAILKAQLADQRPDLLRLFAARILVELSPQHRRETGESLFASASRPGTKASSRVSIASSLAALGNEFHEQALGLLRAVSAQRPATVNALHQMAGTLARLGPEYHEEAARELTRVTEHPHAAPFERTMAWGKLADLGEPHRTAAVLALRGSLLDRSADAGLRVHAARELIKLGPQFHTETAQQLREIASGREADPQLRMSAWRALRALGTRFRHQASTALLEFLGPAEVGAWEAHSSECQFYEGDADPHAAAAAFAVVLHDPKRGVRHRVAAAHSLVELGRRHHAMAVSAFLDLFERNEIPVDELAFAVGGFADVSVTRRAELAEALTTAVTKDTSAELVCETAQALEALGLSDFRIDAAVRALMSEELTAASHRAQATMIVARRQRTEATAALEVVLRLQHGIDPRVWTGYVRELFALGAALPEAVRTITSAPDADLWLRQLCAGLLAECRPELLLEALAELRSQAEDEYLPFTWRTEAVLQLADFDPGTVDDAIAFHRQVLDDEAEAVSHRGEAAYQLMWLDPAQQGAALAVLRRLAGRPDLYDAERADALGWLPWNRLPQAELATLARAIVHDPATSMGARRNAARRLPAAESRQVSRLALADRTAPISAWSDSSSGYWDNWAGANEVEAVLRDMLAGAEIPLSGRIAAAAALGRLSPKLVPEAVARLTELGGRGQVRRQRLLALADLDATWRVRLLSDARVTLDIEERAWRLKLEAVTLLLDLDPRPLTQTDQLRLARLLRDDRITDRLRLRLLLALNRLDDIRAIRDDQRTHPATRALAASDISDYRCEDRAQGARILAALAEDPQSRPVVRWNAAEDLATFGTRGRTLAVERLRAMMTDETLPVLARANSARVLGDIRPDLRSDVLVFLRRLETTANPTVRIQVLKAVGKHEPAEAALALRGIAEDSAGSPVVRLRSAKAMAALHRDHREPAAVVCRELAHDHDIPCHVRAGAARMLALLSALCREEARKLLADIHANWGRQPASRASAAAQFAVPDGS